MTDFVRDEERVIANEPEKTVSPMAQLVEIGHRQGYLTLDDILEYFPEAEENVDELDRVYAVLHKAGILLDHEDLDASWQEDPSHLHVDLGEDFVDPLAGIETDDLIGLYLREAASIPLLSADEETNLARRIERGREARRKLIRGSYESNEHTLLANIIQDEQRALEHLVTANSRLVVSVAKKYIGQGLPLSDLIQEGNIGLMRAAKKFDYRRGYKFSTYATWWIRQAVGRAVATQGRTIRLPVHMKDKINRILRTQHKLKQTLERDPSAEELAFALDMPVEKIEEMLHAARHPLSLETPVSEEGDTLLGDFVEDDHTLNPEDAATNNLLREQLLEALENVLPPREARILKMRYGLLDGEAHTLREVGHRAGVTRERVRQIEAQALKRLREPEIWQKLVGYLR